MLAADGRRKRWKRAKRKEADKCDKTARETLSRPTALELTRFSNHVGIPLAAMLWNPIPMIPSEPPVSKIELVSLARANV